MKKKINKPVHNPAVKYNNPILCAKPLANRPMAATIDPTYVVLRQPNLLMRYDAMGLIQNSIPV